MSVLIKGMDKPKSCTECDYSDWDEGYAIFFTKDGCWCKRLKRLIGKDSSIPCDCPIVEVPIPHGRLIDADALMRSFSYFEFSSNMGDAMEMLAAQPTIIEAEE